MQSKISLSPKINDATEIDIDVLFRRIFVVMGLPTKAADITSEEGSILLSFIKKYYGDLTLNDFNDAFLEAAAHRLNIDTKCYGVLSCEYLGRILTAYINSGIIQERNRVKPEDYFK
jgi:hypothetical protein